MIGITGHNSFIGRHLTEAFDKASVEYLLFEGDIRNPAEVTAFMRVCTTVFHLAGCNRGSDKDVYEINMIGGTNIASSSVTLGNRHIIFPTSNYIIRDPDNPYSVSKRAVEEILHMISGVNNCKTSIFRLSNTFGPLALPFHVSVVASFCWYEANGLGDKMPIIGDGTQVIDLVPVNEVILKFINSLNQVESFSLTSVSGNSLSISDLADTIHDPVKRDSLPLLTETVNFFSKKIDLQMFVFKSVEVMNERMLRINFSEKHSVNVEDHEIIDIPSGYQRHIYRSFSTKCWILLSEGKAALDVFSHQEKYFNTILLDYTGTNCVGVTPEYIYRIRNLSAFSITIRICNERNNYEV